MSRLRGRIRRLEGAARKKAKGKGTHLIIVERGESRDQAQKNYRKRNPDAGANDFYFIIDISGRRETEIEA
jgi:hypothetical protein